MTHKLSILVPLSWPDVAAMPQHPILYKYSSLPQTVILQLLSGFKYQYINVSYILSNDQGNKKTPRTFTKVWSQ